MDHVLLQLQLLFQHRSYWSIVPNSLRDLIFLTKFKLVYREDREE